MSFYLSLFIFISSLIGGLALMIAGKGMRREKFFLLAGLHLIFLFMFIASLALKKSSEGTASNYFFMTFICSGLLLSGVVWRSETPLLLRIYFSFFALTLPLFFFSPSMLLNFLLTTNYSSTNGPVFRIRGNYFLEKQSNSNDNVEDIHYKIILKRGIFHQTVQRDLVFGGELDSIKVLEFVPGRNVSLRGYTNRTTYVSSEIDSMDAEVQLVKNKPGAVEYHL